MKKVIISIMLALNIMAVGCSSQGGEQPTNEGGTNNDVETVKEAPKEEIENIKIGDVITTDRMEITIKNIEFSYDILPDDTSSFYTHYPAESGQVYIHIDTDVKNIQKQDLGCDDIMQVVADYNDGYTYNGSAIPEDSSTGFTYANIESIKPLASLGVRFLVECPQEVEEADNPLFLILKVDNKDYKYTMR